MSQASGADAAGSDPDPLSPSPDKRSGSAQFSPSASRSTSVTSLFSKMQLGDSSERDVLMKLEQEFKKSGLVNKKRWFLNTYKDVFFGKDLVAWLISSSAGSFQVASKGDAVAIGHALFKQQLAHHCLDDHSFEDTDKCTLASSLGNIL
jgi:hypothetical protein